MSISDATLIKTVNTILPNLPASASITLMRTLLICASVLTSEIDRRTHLEKNGHIVGLQRWTEKSKKDYERARLLVSQNSPHLPPIKTKAVEQRVEPPTLAVEPVEEKNTFNEQLFEVTLRKVGFDTQRIVILKKHFPTFQIRDLHNFEIARKTAVWKNGQFIKAPEKCSAELFIVLCYSFIKSLDDVALIDLVPNTRKDHGTNDTTLSDELAYKMDILLSIIKDEGALRALPTRLDNHLNKAIEEQRALYAEKAQQHSDNLRQTTQAKIDKSLITSSEHINKKVKTPRPTKRAIIKDIIQSL